MKKRVFFATMVALACMMTSCMREDDWEMFRHPIHVTGEMNPTFGIPVGTGRMNMNDLLTSFSANYNGVISDTGDMITVLYEISMSDTVFASDFIPDSKGKVKGGKRGKGGAKADAYTKDTLLENIIDIDFFNDVEGLDSIAMAHVWADLSVGVHGDFGNNPGIANNLHVSFDSVELWYDTPNSATPKQFINESLSNFHVEINDLTVDSLYSFPKMDLATVVNDRPSRLYARYHLKLRVDPGIITQNIATMTIQEIIDSLSMAWISYSANMQLKMPMAMRVDNMSYDFDVDLGNGLSSVNLDSILKSINEGLSAEVTSSKFRLVLDNGIPLNLNLTAVAFAGDGVTPLWAVFTNEPVPSAQTAPTADDPMVEEAVSPTRTVLEVVLNKTDIENLKQAKTLKVNIRVNSGNKHVNVKKSDYLDLKAYLEVHPSLTVDISIKD